MDDALSTFNPALPTDRDRLRLAIGDTDTSKAIFEDATYDSMVAGYTIKEATIMLCEAAALKFAQMPDEVDQQNGALIVTYKDRVKAFMAKAEALRKADEPPPAQDVAPMQSGAMMGALPYSTKGFKPY